MEAFYRIHKYLLAHLHSPVRRGLMNEINWGDRLIGIKGSRGVGKTTFLLSYANEYFGPDNRECLYINLNHFIFTERTLLDFAGEFRAQGGRVLLIDQVFKYPNWSKELRYCYDHFPDLRIVFTGSSVMRLREENPDLSGMVSPYYLRGFSFREYLNLMTNSRFPAYTLDEVMKHHIGIAKEICAKTKPEAYFQDYLRHGFYPFFLEKRNFSENLLKTMNMILEVDVLYIKQIEQNYLPKLRRLLYLLSLETPCIPNVSQLSKTIGTSRATVMNYIKYLKEARLINLLYAQGETFPYKPSKVYLYNSNLMYVINQMPVDELGAYRTFFFNQVLKNNRINGSERNADFLVNDTCHFQIEHHENRMKHNPAFYYAADKPETDEGNVIPLWLFGCMY
ncbi:MAG: AAA family ATPase [Tannerella sp.]|jgi:predicted AAA+ superfamily ATPase|nr:AAA family ATPase [Tannerella sp.]